MIVRDDLKAAISAGIVTEAQAASLASLADSRRGARENLSPGDEPFELFRGFNEIFIIVGLIILSFGWIGISGLSGEILQPQRWATIFGGIGALLLWGLSEYFIRRRRMVGPAIALSILFAANAVGALTLYFSEPLMIFQDNYESLSVPFSLAVLATAIYWLRFRVPFAMALIAVKLFALAIFLAAVRQGTPESFSDLFLLSSAGPFAWITLGLGAVVFAFAMVFDMSDPHRVTRRSANGFWLHLVAAPALVNTIAMTLITAQSIAADLALMAVLAFFSVVALVIDRRSFLIAAIGYVILLSATIFEGQNVATTVLILGVALLALGAFWERIRASILAALPFLPTDRLPPATRTKDLI